MFLAVFWRSNRGTIHYVVSSAGQNLIGLFIGVISWAIFDNDYPTNKVSMNPCQMNHNYEFVVTLMNLICKH